MLARQQIHPIRPQSALMAMTLLPALWGILLASSHAPAQAEPPPRNQGSNNKQASTVSTEDGANQTPEGATAKLNRYEYSFASMGTIVRIVAYSNRPDTIEEDLFAAESEANRLIQIFSSYDPESEVSRLNQDDPPQNESNSSWVDVSDELFALLSTADQIHVKTDGAFDPSLGALTRYWRAVRKKEFAYQESNVSTLRTFCGWDLVELDSESQRIRLGSRTNDNTKENADVLMSKLKLSSSVQIDLGGIAKGAIIDAMFDTLKSRDLNICLIDAGGDIRVGQPPPGRDGWRVAIGKLADERKSTNTSIAGSHESSESIQSPEPASYLPGQLLLTLNNQAVATSGDLYQFVVHDGIRYSHILNPKTGLGVLGRRSVSVVADNATIADAYATALSTMPAERAIEYAESNEGIDCIWSSISSRSNETKLIQKKSSMIELEEIPN